MDENKEKFLKSKKFKKKWLSDKSGYWYEKPFKLGEFSAKFVVDMPDFYQIQIITLQEHSLVDGLAQTYEIIWQGSWRSFIKKIEKYG